MTDSHWLKLQISSAITTHASETLSDFYMKSHLSEKYLESENFLTVTLIVEIKRSGFSPSFATNAVT